MNDQTKGTLITLLGVMLIVPDSLFIRLLSADTNTVIVWRSFISAGFVSIGLILYYRTKLFSVYRNMGPNAWGYVIFAAISAPFFALSIRHTSIANTVFILSTMPIFAAFSAWVLMGQRVSKRMIWTITFALSGIAVIAYGSWTGEGGNIVGDLMAVVCTATFGIALTFSNKSKSTSMVPFTPIALMLSGSIFLPFSDPFTFVGNDLPFTLMHTSLIAGATCLLALGPRYITSAEVALLILGESILAPLLAWAVIDEFPGYYALVGGAMVLATLFISNIIALSRSRKR